MKGVYACAYLAVIEEHFGVKLHEHFDLVAGTSTGGIIALGIGAKKTAAEILTFYRDQGALIFPKQTGFRMLVNRLTKGHGYHGTPLAQAVSDVFKAETDGHQLMMDESAVRLCIPSINAATCEPRVFKATKAETQVQHLNRDKDIPMSDVALATSAAPWYLPIAPVSEAGTRFTYIDGGLWANNPSVVAVTEALNYYVGPDREFEGIELLSVALPNSTGFENDAKYRRGLQFVDQLLTYAMESSKLGAHQTTKFLLSAPPNVYFRVKPSNLTEAQKRRLRLDGAERESIEELAMLGRNDAQNDKNQGAIKALFS